MGRPHGSARSKTLLLVAIAAALFGSWTYLYSDKTITATPSEIASVIHPTLKFERVELPPERNAYLVLDRVGRSFDARSRKLFEEVMPQLGNGWRSLLPHEKERVEGFVSQHERLMPEILAAARLGRGAVPKRDGWPIDEDYGAFTVPLKLAIARASILCGENAGQACVAAFDEAVSVLVATCNVYGYTGELVRAEHLVSLLDGQVDAMVAQADTAALRRLLAKMSDLPSLDMWAYAVRADFHDGILPLMVDRARFTEYLVTSVPQWPTDNVITFGSWDSRENGQKASDAAAERVANLARPYKDRVSAATSAVLAWADKSPQEVPHPKAWFESFANNAATRAKMKRIDNSFGRIAVNRAGGADRVGDILPYLNRTLWELMRVAIACAAFERISGSPPEDLEELVAAGLLRKIPLDPFTGEPMFFDASRGIAYSAGQNAVDDGGKRNGDAVFPDIVREMPRLDGGGR